MRKFNVTSRTKEDIIYVVEYDEKNGYFSCNCRAGQCEVACNHSELIRKFINRQTMLPQDYDRFEEIK